MGTNLISTLPSGQVVGWSGSTRATAPANGTLRVQNNASSAGKVEAASYGDPNGTAFTCGFGLMRISLGYLGLGPSDNCRIGVAAAGVLGLYGDVSGTTGGTTASIPNTQAQFTANQNNLAITTRSTWQRWSSDAARDVTGIVAGQSGEEHVIINVGSFNIVLKHQVTSTAANQFLNSTGADITLAPNEAADIMYDATTARWRVWKK